MIGKDKSYRRALRLSDIKLIRHLIRGRSRSGRHPFIIKLTPAQGGHTGSAANESTPTIQEHDDGWHGANSTISPCPADHGKGFVLSRQPKRSCQLQWERDLPLPPIDG